MHQCATKMKHAPTRAGDSATDVGKGMASDMSMKFCTTFNVTSSDIV